MMDPPSGRLSPFPTSGVPRGNRVLPASQPHVSRCRDASSRRARPRHRRRRVPGARRSIGVRQVDHPADARWPRTGGQRQADDRRPGRQRHRTQGPRHRDGVPVVCAVPAHDRGREHRLPPQDQEDPEGAAGGAGARGRPNPRPRRAPRPQAGQAVGRPASARGDGPGDRPRAAGVPDGRAAVEPRRQAPRADADGDRARCSATSA